MPPKQPALTISDQLRQLIQARGLTAYRVAKGADLDTSSIHRFLSGERGLTSDSMDAVCQFLGVSLWEGQAPKPKRTKKNNRVNV